SCVRQTHHCRQLLCPLGSPCGGHEEEELEQYQELHRAVFDGIGMGLDYHQSPAYQLDLDLIAVDVAGTFAAFCLCELHQVADSRGAHTVGEIGVIGTHPTHHELGLGRALPLTWMRLFTVMGFRVVSAWQWMTREIAPPA